MFIAQTHLLFALIFRWICVQTILFYLNFDDDFAVKILHSIYQFYPKWKCVSGVVCHVPLAVPFDFYNFGSFRMELIVMNGVFHN